MKSKTAARLKGAKNIGATLEKRLNEIGVFSLEDLARITPAQAYRKICEQHPDKTMPVCYYLYSLQGALLDLHWNDLPLGVKVELRQQAALFSS